MFKKILIANRGEIACRVAATARRLGIRTVAVYSEADAGARHVMACDEAVCIGGPAPRDSYLRADRILEVALATGALAVHPGYGFLSENAGFARACAAAGVVFIGPPAEAIAAMGSKSAAKTLMEKAGVPLVPGYHGVDNDPALLAREAARIGYPVLIKASAGGGGKGMRRVDRDQDFAAALASCQREAKSSFGDDHVLVERYVLRPRPSRPGARPTCPAPALLPAPSGGGAAPSSRARTSGCSRPGCHRRPGSRYGADAAHSARPAHGRHRSSISPRAGRTPARRRSLGRGRRAACPCRRHRRWP